jgi:hypothetical protein
MNNGDIVGTGRVLVFPNRLPHSAFGEQVVWLRVRNGAGGDLKERTFSFYRKAMAKLR